MWICFNGWWCNLWLVMVVVLNVFTCTNQSSPNNVYCKLRIFIDLWRSLWYWWSPVGSNTLLDPRWSCALSEMKDTLMRLRSLVMSTEAWTTWRNWIRTRNLSRSSVCKHRLRSDSWVLSFVINAIIVVYVNYTFCTSTFQGLLLIMLVGLTRDELSYFSKFWRFV